MKAFEVYGGKKLHGEITPQGAKNEALQIISAVLLTPEPVLINNIPDIIDVNLLIDLLADMGVAIDRIDRHTCRFEASNIQIDKLDDPSFQKKSSGLRGSVMIAGPLLARFKHLVYIWQGLGASCA
jgi:UDP-N-acetylglucosamine 1-carboxyvinyltransferase